MRKSGADKLSPRRSQAIATVIVVYLAFFLALFIVALAGSIATAYGLASWYPNLEKPFFNPPNWLFAPVWTVLYAMIAVAGARLALSPAPDKEPALALYGAQLALNAAWSWVFFYGQALGAAAAVIVTLWFAILGTIVFGWNKDRMASLLMIPYLAWVGFAAILNIAVWFLNG